MTGVRAWLRWVLEHDDGAREAGAVIVDSVDDLRERVEQLERLTTCDERGTTVAERRVEQ